MSEFPRLPSYPRKPGEPQRAARSKTDRAKGPLQLSLRSAHSGLLAWVHCSSASGSCLLRPASAPVQQAFARASHVAMKTLVVDKLPGPPSPLPLSASRNFLRCSFALHAGWSAGGFPKVHRRGNLRIRMRPPRPRVCSRCCFSPGRLLSVSVLATFAAGAERLRGRCLLA